MQLWNLFEGKNLFHPVVDGFVSDELHLAEMVSLMGPPPKQFLERSEKSCQFWDADGTPTLIALLMKWHHSDCALTLAGNWTAQTSIPDQSLETLEKRLNGQDKELLLNLMRKILQWLPEERISAQDLTGDPFLLQFAAGVNVTAE